MKDIVGFVEAARKAWVTSWFGNPLGVLCKKLKMVKQELVKLNKANGNLHSNVASARHRLHSILDNPNDSPLDHQLLLNEREASKLLEGAILEEEALLLQKSRTKWLDLGEGNNSFFFSQTKSNWNTNKIMAL